MKHTTQVEEGQCYRKVLDGSSLQSNWEVRSIVVPIEDLPHAHLVNVNDPGDIRMVSCSTIANRQYFELTRRSGRSVA